LDLIAGDLGACAGHEQLQVERVAAVERQLLAPFGVDDLPDRPATRLHLRYFGLHRHAVGYVPNLEDDLHAAIFVHLKRDIT